MDAANPLFSGSDYLLDHAVAQRAAYMGNRVIFGVEEPRSNESADQVIEADIALISDNVRF